jgi:CubicO group peptidase (beta-lactamase class C family)
MMGTEQNTDYARHVADRLAALAREHGVVGASLAVLHRGEIVAEAATGFANLAAGVEATPDTVFQVGSITKVWTATLALALVEQGRLELDAPIRAVLPELRLETREQTEGVTLRHLLTHTSGIGGDFFADTGRGDDALERLASVLQYAPSIHPLGATFSYCNSGYSLLGRVLEVATGTQWDRLMRERLFQPLGLTRTGTLPEEALRFRAAVGHEGEPPVPVGTWGLTRSTGPAGLITSTAREVLAFAALHMSGGETADGTRLLSADTVAAMLEPQVAVPNPYTAGSHWGLGWELAAWDAARVFGHNGSTIGQAAYFRVLPEHDLALCLLADGGGMKKLQQAVAEEIVGGLADVTVPPLLGPSPAPAPFDAGDYTGRYERAGGRVDVEEAEGGLRMVWTSTGTEAEWFGDTPSVYAMENVDKDVFVVRKSETEAWNPTVFYTLPDGTRYLHLGLRAMRKSG